MSVIADKQVWRVELTLGTRQGYAGPIVVEAIPLRQVIQSFQENEDPWYAIIVWGYGHVMGPTFPIEAVTKITMENNPLYTPDATEEEMISCATRLAELLASTFEQVRVYFSIHPIRSLIYESKQQ